MEIKIGDWYLTKGTSLRLKKDIEEKIGKTLSWEEVLDEIYKYNDVSIVVFKNEDDPMNFADYNLAQEVDGIFITLYRLFPDEKGRLATKIVPEEEIQKPEPYEMDNLSLISEFEALVIKQYEDDIDEDEQWRFETIREVIQTRMNEGLDY